MMSNLEMEIDIAQRDAKQATIMRWAERLERMNTADLLLLQSGVVDMTGLERSLIKNELIRRVERL